MATYITVEQKAAQQLLEANAKQTAANRARLAKSEQIRQAPQTQQFQSVPPVAGIRRTANGDEQLAAFRRGFKADYLVLSYQFFTGDDLDTRTKLYFPVTQSLSGDIGWSRGDTIEVSPGDPIVTWAGDNTGTGFESVLIDVAAYRRAFPGSREIILRTAAFWYDTRGSSVTLTFVGYKGGSMVLQPALFNWINPTALRTYNTYPAYTTTSVVTNIADDVDGDFIAYVYFALDTGRLNYRQTLPT